MTSGRTPAVVGGPGRLAGPAVVGAVLTGALVALRLRDPHVPGSWGVCPSLLLWGTLCPACGALRAAADLTRLDLLGALASNPLVVVLLPVVVGGVLRWGWDARHGRDRPPWPTDGRFWAVAGVLLVAFGVWRNLPGGQWLGP